MRYENCSPQFFLCYFGNTSRPSWVFGISPITHRPRGRGGYGRQMKARWGLDFGGGLKLPPPQKKIAEIVPKSFVSPRLGGGSWGGGGWLKRTAAENNNQMPQTSSAKVWPPAPRGRRRGAAAAAASAPPPGGRRTQPRPAPPAPCRGPARRRRPPALVRRGLARPQAGRESAGHRRLRCRLGALDLPLGRSHSGNSLLSGGVSCV